jgi:hypothetical protein
VICPRLFWAFRDDVCASGRFCGSFYSSLSSLLMVVTHVPFLMDLLFLFSPLPPLSCVGLMSSGSISFHFLVTQEHDANRVLIVSHDDILQTYVKMRGAQSSFKNQDVPTLVLGYPSSSPFCAYIRFLPLLTLCIHSPNHVSHHRFTSYIGFGIHVSFFLLVT